MGLPGRMDKQGAPRTARLTPALECPFVERLVGHDPLQLGVLRLQPRRFVQDVL
jgi:hypothetical protein